MCRSAKRLAALALPCCLLVMSAPVSQVSGRSRSIRSSRDRTDRHVQAARDRTDDIATGDHCRVPMRHPDLAAYYFASNPELCRRLETARGVYEHPGASSFHGATLIAGDAGVGKTYLKNYVFSKEYPNAAVCKFDVRELYETWQKEGTVVLKPDLCDQGVVINELLALSDGQAKPLLQFLKSKDASFYVMDSLDELHPDEYLGALEQIEEFVSSPGPDFVHVVVLGRPFAFLKYWQRKSDEAASADINLFLLAPPHLQTTGDLLVSSWNYYTWKYGAKWSLSRQSDGVLVPAGITPNGRKAALSVPAGSPTFRMNRIGR